MSHYSSLQILKDNRHQNFNVLFEAIEEIERHNNDYVGLGESALYNIILNCLERHVKYRLNSPVVDKLDEIDLWRVKTLLLFIHYLCYMIYI